MSSRRWQPTSSRRPGSSARGFTVVELLLIVVVLGILVAIAVPLYGGYQERARVAQAVTDIRLIESQLDSYRLEFDRVPQDYTRIVVPAPVDPWGRPYRYLRLQPMAPGDMGKVRKDKNLVPLNSDYDLYSVGRDGATKAPLTPSESQDDVIRANDGGFVGLASDY